MIVRILAWLTAGLTVVLLVVGGLVHGTGSGLACPDWPLCHGMFFPAMTGGVEFEHTHRLIAGAVALLTLGLAVGLWPRGGVRRGLGVVAVFLILIQAGLGGLTVLLQLPALISILHSAISFLFLSLITLIAWLLREPAYDSQARVPLSPRGLAPLCWAVLYAEMVLGAVVRFLGAGLACPDLPFCHGVLWPPSGEWPARLQMIHRGGALLTVALAAVFLFSIRRRHGSHRLLRGVTGSALVLILIQIGLGAASVLSFLGLLPVTAHLAVAALLLIHLTILWASTSAA